MPSAANLQPDGRMMALFIGAKHSGKTCAATSFVRDPQKRTKVLDFDGRIRGILGAPWIDKNRIDYEYYPPRVGNNQTPTYQKINNDMEAMLVQCNTAQNPYETVICDSLTAETFALVCDAIPLTHQGNKGKKLGVMNMAGPEDYGFEATGTYNLMAFLRSLPIPYVIVTAHIVDKFGKADPENPFSESVITGEKLSIRDKIGTNIGIYFDHIFRFERRMVGAQERFFVRFRSSIACTSFAELPNGEVDITGKSFHDVLLSYINPNKK
jgi:hypothetical protein